MRNKLYLYAFYALILLGSCEEKKPQQELTPWGTPIGEVEGMSDGEEGAADESANKNKRQKGFSLEDILECADIRQIYCNGATAWKYYRKYQEKQLGREAVRLPSTSPANAAWSVERLLGEWSQCGEVLRNGE